MDKAAFDRFVEFAAWLTMAFPQTHCTCGFCLDEAKTSIFVQKLEKACRASDLPLDELVRAVKRVRPVYASDIEVRDGKLSINWESGPCFSVRCWLQSAAEVLGAS